MRTIRGVLTALALVASAALPVVADAGAIWAPATLDQYFRLEWGQAPAAGGATIAGHVTNLGNGPAERMQLLVERLDAAGAVVGSSTAWVVGVVPANRRTYFTARVPAAAAYRVSILAFDWMDCRN